MSSQTSPVHRIKKVALCYVRLSQARDGDDAVSPERQRANILAKCRELGYQPEWYEDVDGHKSGREVKNRPGWQALSNRLGDPDVVALIGNDLARFHRKGWRVGDLVEFIEEHNIALVLAAPGREIDTSTPMGKVFVYLTAIFDEFYADDISYRVKDSIIHRKNLGKSVGKPPFGTLRDTSGYLMPNNEEGAWWLVDGRYIAGNPETSPEENAVWHTYYESAKHALTLFAEGNIGVEKLSYQLNEEGYPFSDRKGQPRRWCRDDVRRVVANWPEYGGLVFDQPAKDRPVHTRDEIDGIHLDADRAVFPLELLKRVAYVRSDRTMLALDRGSKKEAYPYPLSHITRCAQCERLVRQENDPRLRTYLGGTMREYGRVYRHKPGVDCGCEYRSVTCDALEEDFGTLIKGLVVNENALALMVELSQQTPDEQEQRQTLDMAQNRQRSIIKLKKKIENLKTLFREAEVDEDEYRARLAEYRAELAYWEAYTTEKEQVVLQLSMCLAAIDKVARLWDLAEAKERRTMAHNLFEYIVYDLDTQRIVDFRLKPWANRFLVLRAALYAEETSNKQENENASASGRRNMPHTGFQDPLR
ncbi:MAG: recombinase family protein, partial [Anaerolineae bacterium]|nr:recombinase family protein [Anaerolineae bacterium]